MGTRSGSHSYQHLELNSLTDAELDFQLAENHRLVKQLTAYDMVCFRSPWGTSFTKEREIAVIEAFPYQIENRWTIDASDYNVAPGLDPVAQAAIVSRTIADELADAQDGDTVLLHDGTFGKQSTVDGVALFLAEHGNEYEFRAIPGCGGAEVTTPAPASTPNQTATPKPTTTPKPTSTPTSAGPSFSGPMSEATSITDLLAASDYRTADADYLRLYHALLARKPDITGSRYWLAQARQGVDLDAVAWSFAQSVEFQQKYGTLTDAQFVTTVYANVLGRSPDTAGRDYWLDEVRSGRLRRHGVVRWMAESVEFKRAHPYDPSGISEERSSFS